MKRKALQQLIEHARRGRDDAALRVAGAHREADGAQRTLDTLTQYRSEQLRNADARASIDPAVLRLRDRFAQKLDGAIDEQTRVRNSLQDAVDLRREELVGRQRRLLAFETLQARSDAASTRRRERAEQRDTDERAAQASRRPRNGDER